MTMHAHAHKPNPPVASACVPPPVRHRPSISTPGDAFEREADAVADRVLRMADAPVSGATSPTVQRTCAACEDDARKRVQRRAAGGDAALDTTAAAHAAAHGGEPLASEVRAYFEPRFGRDFSRVRVHTDDTATRAVQARAYTYGSDIVFGRGEYAPSTHAGRHLLAHELTHVVQQGAASVHPHARAAPSIARAPSAVQRQPAQEPPLESDDALLACLALAPWPLKGMCFDLASKPRAKPKTFDDPRCRDPKPPAPTPAPAPGVSPPQGLPPLPFFHGTTWAIAQTIPGNVKPLGGGDFGQGFYTHHDADMGKASERARWEGCRLCQKLTPKVRYAGVIRFDVEADAYKKLFSNRKTFGLTSTKQADYAARQKDWLDFVSGTGRGREAKPGYDTAHMAWRHARVDPPPDQGFDLIEGPMYKGVEGLPGSSVPARSAFDPYAEGTALPQQVVWNHDRALGVLNAAKTTLKQYDAQDHCKEVDPPVAVKAAASATEDPKAREEARIGMTGH